MIKKAEKSSNSIFNLVDYFKDKSPPVAASRPPLHFYQLGSATEEVLTLCILLYIVRGRDLQSWKSYFLLY